ncbi:type II toxin-antitoxin system VapC family toxin [Candidatus Poribacteria bacterium]|nr:type II toxin-antitoxin system VapC family toxin [Candidatus Poribacteria bacterium]MYH82828.1 type II toxin-antitoxin system VapC family toxin [Candidatus Poribacteria bacterium]MYK96598.1 type II toxin-antitoxin system VapC family toxin [Candidatus Poribacteria bacterium]
MKYLLDTHTLLWFLKGDKKLSDKARQLIDSPHNEKFIGIVSLWEIAIKVSLGKLVLNKPFEKLFPEQLDFNRIGILDIIVDSLIKLTTLPFHHRYPFGRLIIAQALVEGFPIIGADTVFDAYGVNREW